MRAISVRELGWARDRPNGLLVRARSAWARASRLQFLLVTLGLSAVVTTELIRLAAREYDKDYYFDEMWRADLVRTPQFVQRYLANNAPAPPGWFFVLRLVGIAMPNGPKALRLESAVLDVLMFLLLALLLDRMLTRSRRPPVTRLVAPVSAVLVVLFPAYANLAQYLNDYMFQAACTIGVVVLWRVHDEWAPGRIALLTAIVLLPLVTLSGLLLLPVIAADMLRRDFVCARRGAPRWRLAGTIGAFVGSAGAALTLYEWLYRPVVDHQIRRYWADATLSESPLGSILQTSWSRLMQASISDAVSVFPSGYNAPVAGALLVGLAVAGFILLGRLWVWFPIAFVSAWAMAAVASLASWPMTPERVNLPVLWMFHTAVVVAVVYAAARLVRHPTTMVGMGAVLLWAFWPAPPPHGAEPFARGLTSDLDVVAASPDSRNIVVSYHPMSHWYADDRLVTSYHGPDTFTVVREPWHDPAPLYSHPDDVVRAAGWRPGTAVWCVIPYEVGPEQGSRACRLELPGLSKRVQIRRERAYIIGWLPSPTPLPASSGPGR
ncbi:MAG: hypothetical protein JF922_05730 [Candidatus Dormibacteraeota bacterium]|uniref:Uncharacterized protein n=1 Tax=Candidatus Nephthysia bennettiae TaxID=3127016 RepID=A0A934K8B8_9BACT|nr:hypothetical protein [Candidatus Dormibacteraeota bacterium]MBJ7613910.1 hypothetical protein [Candidatus Dormibacteraeota bacterium]